jgi:hypothetical protein
MKILRRVISNLNKALSSAETLQPQRAQNEENFFCFCKLRGRKKLSQVMAGRQTIFSESDFSLFCFSFFSHVASASQWRKVKKKKINTALPRTHECQFSPSTRYQCIKTEKKFLISETSTLELILYEVVKLAAVHKFVQKKCFSLVFLSTWKEINE